MVIRVDYNSVKSNKDGLLFVEYRYIMAKTLLMVVVLSFTLCSIVNSQKTKRKTDHFSVNKEGLREINIASLLPADEWRLFSIKRVSPAIEIAIEKVNPALVSRNCTLVIIIIIITKYYYYYYYYMYHYCMYYYFYYY